MKKMLLLVIALFLLTVLVSGCATDATPIPPTPTSIPPTPLPPTLTPEPTATPIVYNVELDVVDEEGNIIPEAKIIQDEIIEYTDNKGIWQKSLENSYLSFNVWAQGYSLQEYSSDLHPGDNKIQI